MITREQLLEFMRKERYAVQATVSGSGSPQAAVVGVAVSDRFEIVFDTLDNTRKALNLRENPAVALVMGAVGADTVRSLQVEGLADELTGADLDRLLEVYFARFPDGRARRSWPGITYFRVTPHWLRYSDYACDPPVIVELDGTGLTAA